MRLWLGSIASKALLLPRAKLIRVYPAPNNYVDSQRDKIVGKKATN